MIAIFLSVINTQKNIMRNNETSDCSSNVHATQRCYVLEWKQ